jgi:hypothetical protein
MGRRQRGERAGRQSFGRGRPGRLLMRVAPTRLEERPTRGRLNAAQVAGLAAGALALWMVWEVRGLTEAVAVARAAPPPTLAASGDAGRRAVSGMRPAATASARSRSAVVRSSRSAPRKGLGPDEVRQLAERADRARLDEAECLASIKERDFPSETEIEGLRRQLRFRWGSRVDVDPITGRPRSPSSGWNPYYGQQTGAENTDRGGWVVGRGLPSASIWEAKNNELRLLQLCVEKVRLLRQLRDPIWEDRALIREMNAGPSDDGPEAEAAGDGEQSQR